MIITLDEAIEKKIRGNVRYVYPLKNINTISNYISALANSEGGTIFLGVMDNGLDIIAKGYSGNTPDKSKSSELLGGFDSFEIREINKTTTSGSSRIIAIDVEKSNSGVRFQDRLYKFKDNYTNKLEEIYPIQIFISYNRKTSKYADVIQENIEKNYGFKVKINRDNQLQYKDNIDEFMKSIKENDIVISLITSPYLKSEACMYEITELMKDDSYQKKFAFIILSQNDLQYTSLVDNIEDLVPTIYDRKRYDYITYWSNEKAFYIDKMKQLESSITAITELSATIKRVGRITDEIGSFLNDLNNLNGKDFYTMYQEDFSDIKNMINSKM